MVDHELSVRYLMSRGFKSCLTHQPTGSDDGNHGVLFGLGTEAVHGLM